MTSRTLLVGICGRTGSGKSTLAARLQNKVDKTPLRCCVLSMDDFYCTLGPQKSATAKRNDYDFDCLEAFDLQRLKTTLEAAQQHQAFSVAPYRHATYSHGPLRTGGPFDVVIVEGLYLFADDAIADMFDLRVFIDVDADESLMRRIRRDLHTRTDSIEHILAQYERYVIPAYEHLVKPSKRKAHLIVRHGAHNEPAFRSVLSYIHSLAT